MKEEAKASAMMKVPTRLPKLSFLAFKCLLKWTKSPRQISICFTSTKVVYTTLGPLNLMMSFQHWWTNQWMWATGHAGTDKTGRYIWVNELHWVNILFIDLLEIF